MKNLFLIVFKNVSFPILLSCPVVIAGARYSHLKTTKEKLDSGCHTKHIQVTIHYRNYEITEITHQAAGGKTKNKRTQNRIN